MSSHHLHLVPRAVEWQPKGEAAGRAVELLKAMSLYPEAISCEFHETIQFFEELAPDSWTAKRESLWAVTPIGGPLVDVWQRV